ncbi:MAG: hypothetical protein NZ853_07635 [Leptospiraceae bacterium]|nr:hypothetical protein [Leptospiraceae bacterium]MDW7975694.1 hypothetical protein [Leptospiraceae bacterium]
MDILTQLNGNPDAIKEIIQNLEAQLVSLYAEKEYLEKEIGVSDPVIIVEMIRNMEKQLIDLYKERQEAIYIDTKEIVIQGPKKIIVRKNS